MAVNSTHKDYDKMLPIWEKCEHASEGQDAVHAAGTVYLPKLSDQTDHDYKAYKQRATFFNATGRTVDGLVGMVTRKEPVLDAQDSFATYLDDVDLQGTDINEFVEYVLREVIETNRLGILVEYPQGVQNATLAQLDALNIRPYLTTYDADDIINWRVQRVNNFMQPVLIVLSESYEVISDYETDYKEQIRSLILEDGKYIQRVYRKNEKDEWIQFGPDIIPLKNGAELGYIPFVLCGQHDNFEPKNPIILDLVNLNLAHYRVSADYEHGCHFTGLPTPVVTGYQSADDSKEKFYIGSTSAWVFPQPDAKASFLEFSGQGLGALERNLESKERQMAILGARIIENQKSGVEAYQTAQLRANGENSTLASIAILLSKQIERALNIMSDWAGLGEVKLKLNTDYYPVTMTSQDLAELVKAWQSGAISYQTMFESLKKGEIIADNVTVEEEQARIAEQPPTITTLAA